MAGQAVWPGSGVRSPCTRAGAFLQAARALGLPVDGTWAQRSEPMQRRGTRLLPCSAGYRADVGPQVLVGAPGAGVGDAPHIGGTRPGHSLIVSRWATAHFRSWPLALGALKAKGPVSDTWGCAVRAAGQQCLVTLCLQSRWAESCSARPSPPTSRSAWTSPAPSLALTGAWSRMPPTSLCTWAPCRRPCSSRFGGSLPLPSSPHACPCPQLSACLPAQIQHLGADLHPGDVLLSNHPSAGGSHLPDLTVITPVRASAPGTRGRGGHTADRCSSPPGVLARSDTACVLRG